MPYKIFPLRGTRFYKVINTDTGAVKAKRTTRRRALAQVRLLEGLEHGTLVVRGRR
jgi:hypothetical protein